jgi:hypothetical protein
LRKRSRGHRRNAGDDLKPTMLSSGTEPVPAEFASYPPTFGADSNGSEALSFNTPTEFLMNIIASDPAWKYVNVRRLFIFLEHSIDDATQYAVFEPNDVPLWERLRGSVTAFLTTQWRNGMLQGKTPGEAFFVKIGLGETMTQDDIDNGRLICIIGIAPVKPAEFVIFRIAHTRALTRPSP